MKQVFPREGFGTLRASWAILVASIAVAAAVAGGSHWYLERQKRESATIAKRTQEGQGRAEAARRERESLEQSADVFRTLAARGLLQSERRLDLVELVNGLRIRHQLFGLDYEIGAQRPLPLAGGLAFPALDVLASRVKLRARALHEGDLLEFIDALSQSHQGFYPVDRCVIRRIEARGGGEALQPHVEAECTLEWITLKEKRANRPA
ncbi:MAG: hypothetical protein ABIR98_13780 [Usitatibacter sp.]